MSSIKLSTFSCLFVHLCSVIIKVALPGDEAYQFIDDEFD